MYICIYIYIYNIYVYIFIYIYMYIYACTYFLYMYEYKYFCFVYICIFIHTRIHTYVYIYMYIGIYQMSVYLHICTHTHTNQCPLHPNLPSTDIPIPPLSVYWAGARTRRTLCFCAYISTYLCTFVPLSFSAPRCGWDWLVGGWGHWVSGRGW